MIIGQEYERYSRSRTKTLNPIWKRGPKWEVTSNDYFGGYGSVLNVFK